MKRIFAPFLAALVLVSFKANSAVPESAFFRELPRNLTVTYGAPIVPAPLPIANLRLLVWNVHKGEDRRLPIDFGGLSQYADISLFQEAVSDAFFTSAVAQANTLIGWTLATSWELIESTYTGVATGSRVKPIHEDVIVSKVVEPITSTPKTMLVSEFNIEGRTDTLLVVNVHGINFVTTWEYRKQMRQLQERIVNHHGPLIVAGDFNTWNMERFKFVVSILSPLGLNHVTTPPTGDFFSLDHIFVRGLTATKVHNYNQVSSSDHRPLLVDFSFDAIPAQ
ncbi:MAG: endonuclease/exonuclease/phosphatase family protein [Bdellovibrionaceae bacterium]|nr:endonuclease/exonuclease/phosphatase family protein [Pseudobdellovibrionaceae bacterium]